MKQPRYSDKTIIEWADITDNTAFISQPKCEEIMDERWFGRMAYCSGQWNGLRVCKIFLNNNTTHLPPTHPVENI